VKLSLYFFTEHHDMKAYRGSGGVAPHILDVGTRLRWVSRQLHVPAALPPRKDPLVPIG
jgi:hypothetical protein